MMNKLSRKSLMVIRSLLLVGVLIAAAMLLSACGKYGSPRYPDGKAPYSSNGNHSTIA